jgi:membrane-associated phospholipid phosphatase
MQTWFRPEEVIALSALIALAWITRHRAFSFRLNFATSTSCCLPVVVIGISAWLTRRPGRRAWRVVRDFLPFGIAIWAYENMHDLTAWLPVTDRYKWLIAADEWLCRGVNPVVWMQRWVHPWLTTLMTAAYSTYYFYAPVLAMILYWRGRIAEFRDMMLAVVLAFYIGLLGYVAVPALDPFITMRDRFTVSLQATPLANRAYDLYTISRFKVPRDCFPSLHAAISLVVLGSAWRRVRGLFWLALPCVLAMLVATIYLRVHYLVDLLAAVPLAMFSLWASPRINKWWFAGGTGDETCCDR